MKNGFSFSFTRQFAIHEFVGPVAQAARLFEPFHSNQYVSAASPIAASQAGLNNGVNSALHGCDRCFIRCLLHHFRKIDDRETFGAQAIDVSFFVFQSALLEHVEMWVLPRGLCNRSFCEAEIQGGEMTT